MWLSWVRRTQRTRHIFPSFVRQKPSYLYQQLTTHSSYKELPVSIVLASSLNRVIGKKGQLPWGSVPLDWSFFSTVTQKQYLIVGRKSYEEFGAAIPNRFTIIVSNTLELKTSKMDPVWVASSLENAIQIAKEHANVTATNSTSTSIQAPNRIFIGGGEQIIEETFQKQLAESMYLTRMHQYIQEGDTFLPSTWNHHFPILEASTTLSTPTTSLSFEIWKRSSKLY
jgi:dihydrofolate reductase